MTTSNRHYTLVLERGGGMSTVDAEGGKSRREVVRDAILAMAKKISKTDPDGFTAYVFGQSYTRFENMTEANVDQLFADQYPLEWQADDDERSANLAQRAAVQPFTPEQERLRAENVAAGRDPNDGLTLTAEQERLHAGDLPVSKAPKTAEEEAQLVKDQAAANPPANSQNVFIKDKLAADRAALQKKQDDLEKDKAALKPNEQVNKDKASLTPAELKKQQDDLHAKQGHPVSAQDKSATMPEQPVVSEAQAATDAASGRNVDMLLKLNAEQERVRQANIEAGRDEDYGQVFTAEQQRVRDNIEKGRDPNYGQVFTAKQDHAAGATNLSAVFRDLFGHLKQGEDAKGGNTVIVLLNTAPQGRDVIYKQLSDASSKVSDADQLSVYFVQMGANPDTSDFLKHLDDGLVDMKFNIVNHKTFKDFSDGTTATTRVLEDVIGA